MGDSGTVVGRSLVAKGVLLDLEITIYASDPAFLRLPTPVLNVGF